MALPVALTVNNTQVINSASTTIIKLTNFRPEDNGLFLITFDTSGTPLYVIGWADTIQYNGATQTGLGL